MSTEGKHRLAAVWFADIVGYTDLASRDEKAALRVVDELQRLAREEVESRGGRIVKFIGDAALATFDSANTALESALALQGAFSESELAEEKDCALRIGLHLGEVVEAEDGDIYGDGVNVASRIEGQAEAGQVVVSEDVHRLLRQQAEHSFTPFGPVRLKGVEEPMWLYVVGAPEGAVPAVREATVPESTALYNAVTKHWPKIALGSVGAVVAAGVAFGQIAGASVQSYVFAWATMTGGIWFLFDKAEAAISGRSRRQVVELLREVEFGPALISIPRQFGLLFDKIFGDKHLTLHCFWRSCVASLVSSTFVGTLLMGWMTVRYTTMGYDGLGEVLFIIGLGTVLALLFNVFPDYLSLLETRWILGRAHAKAWLGRALVIDFVLTFAISLSVTALVGILWDRLPDENVGSWLRRLDGAFIMAIVIMFASGFFTSVWLWLYALSVPISRVLLRMNSGVGFLLRVTDVEKQPFRSMGFISVLIVTGLFLAGLPFVLF